MHTELQQIYWYSGVYLQPQHLQSIDLHHNYMHARQRQLAQPWNVGIINCEFSSEILVNYTLKIDRLQAILPSGDYLEFPGNTALQSRQFRHDWKRTEKPLILWLALRRFSPGGSNVGDSPNSRWIRPQEEHMMKDMYFNGPECSVSRILYHAQILCDEEKNAAVDCEFLPLLQVCYDNDRVVADPNFCPPVVALNGSRVLQKLLEGIYAELANKTYQFSEYKRHEQPQKTINGDIISLLVMRTLNRCLPLLHHYCQTPGVHPWLIYGLLTQLIGELSCFSTQDSFSGEWGDGRHILPPYEHFNLFHCFSSIKKTLISLLSQLSLTDNIWVKFTQDESGLFLAVLPLQSWQHTGTVLLQLQSETTTLNTIDNDGFKLAHEPVMERLIKHALPGITTTYLNQAPKGVPDRKDLFYFVLDQTDPMWINIQQQQNMAFYWGEAPPDLQVQLIFMEE